MNKLRRTVLAIICCFILLISGCAILESHKEVKLLDNIPSAQREFRAAWVATVANINWPSKPGLTTDEQKQEAVKLLDLLQDHNFNAVIFQVRPQCDALYNSDLEPWSYYLTGQQGQAPDPYYDPLEFWLEQAHERGLELHVWLNPYRAHHQNGGEISDVSIVKTRPELAVELKNGTWWLDPANSRTQDYSFAVVMDLVERYDIDGVHFDDYFYPYPSYNDNLDFPDDDSWREYKDKGGKLSRGDWRRSSVNNFIKRVYRAIKQEKPFVKFGLSPFGIWRPQNPESIRGFDQYDQLYADARLWINQGWVDYWTPQLYWPVNQIPQSYPVLLGWWAKENKKNRHLWPGISIGRVQGDKGIDEGINQIMITRGLLPDSPGNVHWSIGSLVNSEKLAQGFLDGPYKLPALVPASPWLDNQAPQKPDITTSFQNNHVEVRWTHINQKDVFRWVVYAKYGDIWSYQIFNRNDTGAEIPVFKLKTGFIPSGTNKKADIEKNINPLTFIAVTAVDRVGNESDRAGAPVPDISFARIPAIDELISASLPVVKDVANRKKPPVIKLGIEVLIEDYLYLIKGKRVGLITNPSAVDSELKSDIDILAGLAEVNLVALFGAEHGVRGAKQGRINQQGIPDPQTGIPVYSLYSDTFAPKQEWLNKLDVLIFDIQGVGSAWYTFKYSMSFAMEACAREGIKFIILDRPNPLGGLVVEGPFLKLGPLFRHPLPLRHGLTYGELAIMWNETEKFGADITVIKMKGWQRDMMWENTGLLWVMPSPNMGTMETAFVYPGQCLFERTNISEARGTTKPFLLTGAPWIDAVKAANDLNGRGLPGVMFRPVHFIPKSAAHLLPTRSNTRKKPWNIMCHGVEVMLTDYKTYRSVETALHIFDAYQKTNIDSLIWTPPEIIKTLLEPGKTVKDVVRECQDQVSEFVEKRKKYFLYE